MGLYAELDLHSLGFWPETRNAMIPVDYSMGNEMFKSLFHTAISASCPIRTGNLLGSIHCEAEDMILRIYTQCPYAEYVEYGTWKQMAQPYFEQAIEQAFMPAYALWKQSYESALVEEYWWVFDDVWNQVMSDLRAGNSPLFAERWAHNAAVVSVKSQATHLYIEPTPPATMIMQEDGSIGQIK